MHGGVVAKNSVRCCGLELDIARPDHFCAVNGAGAILNRSGRFRRRRDRFRGILVNDFQLGNPLGRDPTLSRGMSGLGRMFGLGPF